MKARYSEPCANCGYCCRSQLCPAAELAFPGNGSVKVKNYNNNLSVAGSSMCAHFEIDLEKIKQAEITKTGVMLIIST